MTSIRKALSWGLCSNMDIRRDVFYNISQLQNNWNGYGAAPIPEEVILKARLLYDGIIGFPKPDVFPTADGSIQFEWGDNVEIEIFKEKIEYLTDKDGQIEEGEIKTGLDGIIDLLSMCNIK